MEGSEEENKKQSFCRIQVSRMKTIKIDDKPLEEDIEDFKFQINRDETIK